MKGAEVLGRWTLRKLPVLLFPPVWLPPEVRRTTKDLIYCKRKPLLQHWNSATGDNLTVMITGKLQELDHNPATVQVVATNAEEGVSL